MISLEELVLKVRDATARGYISEAVAVYNARAFRAAIITTWTAVVYDILAKLRELELTGDAEAKSVLDRIDRYQATGDVPNLLKFEREVLNTAKDRFQLLSPSEADDLERLRDDRNRCAHPTLVSREEVYQPAPELARYHLNSAVHHLLQHPPVQGKAALDRLTREVQSPYFPTDSMAAARILNAGPFSRPKESLARNFLIILLKAAVALQTEAAYRLRCQAALQASQQLHPNVFRLTMEGKATDILRAQEDELSHAVLLIAALPSSWEALAQDVREKLLRYVHDMPEDQMPDTLLAALGSDSLRPSALARIASIRLTDITKFLPECPPELVDRAVALLMNASSFKEANAIIIQVILPLIRSGLVTADHADAILIAARDNSQLNGAVELRLLLGSLGRVMDRERYHRLLSDRGLIDKLPRPVKVDEDDDEKNDDQ